MFLMVLSIEVIMWLVVVRLQAPGVIYNVAKYMKNFVAYIYPLPVSIVTPPHRIPV